MRFIVQAVNVVMLSESRVQNHVGAGTAALRHPHSRLVFLSTEAQPILQRLSAIRS
jgi:hypothetical protein